MWVKIALFISVVITIITLIYAFIKCHNDPVPNSIIIQNGTDLTGVNERIIKAHIAKTYINSLTSPFPITHEFSHWMVILETEKHKHYLISTSPKRYIEIINTECNKYSRCIAYNYQGRKEVFIKTRSFDVKNVNMNVIDYCNAILQYYITRGEYNLFSNNCQDMVEYGLVNVLKITEAKDELKHSYNFAHIAADILRNKTMFTPSA